MEQATFTMKCFSVTNACQEQCAAKPFFSVFLKCNVIFYDIDKILYYKAGL